jgi:valyl-tRNA synthetase
LYRELYVSLVDTNVDTSILTINHPIFPGVSEELFQSVKNSYGEKAVEVVREV